MLAAAALTLAGCRNAPPFEPPPRADDAIEIPPQSSVIAVPITADLTDLSAQLAREIAKLMDHQSQGADLRAI